MRYKYVEKYLTLYVSSCKNQTFVKEKVIKKKNLIIYNQSIKYK